MFPIESFQKTIVKIVDILKSLGIPFHLTGGITSVAYGEPRMTQDIDIVLQNKKTDEQLPLFIKALSNSDFMFDQAAIEKAVEAKKMFQLFDTAEALKLDMYPREMIAGELSRSEIAEVFEQMPLPIVSRIDAAASKLIWISKGSHKSRRDLRQIFRNLSDDDRERLSLLVSELGLTELLREVLLGNDEIVD